MKILLMRPPFRDFIYRDPPLGIGYIASVLRKEGHEVHIRDYVVQKFDLVNAVDKLDPNIIGITCPFSSQSMSVHRAARLVKSLSPSAKVVVGGAHASSVPHEVLKDENVDLAVIGEGEQTMIELAKALEEGESVNGIGGIAFREKGRVVVNERERFIDDLDSIPFPSWDLLPMEEYLKSKRGHSVVVKRRPFFSVITSRGCPLHCIFCSIHDVWGYRWRARSAENVVDEIEALVYRFGVREIRFEDDNLSLDKKRMRRICDCILERGIDIAWSVPNGIAIWTLDKPLIQKMAESGCYSLCFGIESGDQWVRNKLIGKPINLNHARKVIRWCKEAGIWTSGYFIVGLPYENEKTFRKTLNVAKELDLDGSSFFIATPLPGAPLHTLCKEKGYVDTFDWAQLRVDKAVIETEDFTKKDVERWQKRAYKEFVYHRIRRELTTLSLLRRVGRMKSSGDMRFYCTLLSWLLGDWIRK